MKFLSLILLLLTVSCNKSGSEGTSTGNPVVAIQFQSYSSMSLSDPSDTAAQAVSSLKMCLKRLRFKVPGAAEESPGEYIDLALGETSILSTGTLVTTASIPRGTYSRVEFDLHSSCSSGKSLQVTNSNGSFTTDDSMTIRFNGTLVLQSSQDLNLNIQAIVSALNSVNSGQDLKSAAEGASGSF